MYRADTRHRRRLQGDDVGLDQAKEEMPKLPVERDNRMAMLQPQPVDRALEHGPGLCGGGKRHAAAGLGTVHS